MDPVDLTYDGVDAFSVAAMGEPGRRVFLMQCRQGSDSVTVKCEKQQAEALATYLRKILADLPHTVAAPQQPLEAPFEPAFVLGQIGLGFERSESKVFLQLDEIGELDENGDLIDSHELGRIRVLLDASQALAFCEQAEAVVAAGRPICRWCEQPIDPEGHRCPRMN